MSFMSLKATIATLLMSGVLASAASAQVFRQTNLITDDPTINPALVTSPLMKNVWGLSFSPTGDFWASNNGTGTSTLYVVDPHTNAATLAPFAVTIPGDGSVTGQVFNGTSGFNHDPFVFVSEDGTISGWKPGLNPNIAVSTEVFQAGTSANVYKGSAIATVGGHTYLYAANFRAGTIDVIGGDANAPALSGKFQDAGIPSGFAPFNVQTLQDKNGHDVLYVTYARQDGSKHDDVAGAGNGFVDAFDTSGNFLGRVGSQGTLDSPWGLAIAPSTFGAYAGDLLVGNFGDGRINVFDLAGDTFLGQLLDEANNPVAIDGLWALTPGNNGQGGSAGQLYFSAGPNGEQHGLFGSLQSVPEPGSIGLMTALCVTGGIGFLRRRKGSRQHTAAH